MSNKVKWISVIVSIFVLIMVTNLDDRGDFQRIQDSIETLYEDRLVAQDYLFEMIYIYHEKSITAINLQERFNKNQNELLNQKLSEWIDKFGATKFTIKEGNLFNELESEFVKLKEIETSFQSGFTEAAVNQYESNLTDFYRTLHYLSQLQVEEGRRQLYMGQKSIESIYLLKNIEMFSLAILAVLAVVLIVYKPKEE